MNELELFAAAIAISDSAERAAFLERECADNSELRTRLDALLAAHLRSNPLLDQPQQPITIDSPGDAVEPIRMAAETAGNVIAGKYKLLQQIGEGGMGTVWMADQTEPIKRRVAVKLIRVERGRSQAILSRFEAERQAIALMDHAHIARLLDAGTAESGAPFFVMELVKGVPLTDFCDTHKLDISQRLNLFMQICSAVQHAHQKGIIHRDLKPSNILVESHDGKPVPKIIDFGLAKATTGLQLTEHTLFTAFGSVIGTPLYMAPEQANFDAVDVDTRADIYALGVILYELLTGTTPIARETFKKVALDEILKLIRDQEAPTPSSRLSAPDSAPSVAANRQMEPAKLGRFVSGELDWIVLKALAKERERRYETANGFARDIERFLNHEPVTAGPPTGAYRLRKFVRRNRGQVIAASLVLVTLLAGMIGTTAGFFEARRQAEIARAKANDEKAARDHAEKEKRRADDNATQADKARTDAEWQLGRAKSFLFTVQLRNVGLICESYPQEALALLEDTEVCPADRRDLAWRFYEHYCRRRLFVGHTRMVRSVALSGDGRTLVSGSEDGTVKVWDVGTRQLRATLTGHTGEVWNVALSADGTILASGSTDGTIRLWDVAAQQERAVLPGHTGAVLALSADGKIFVGGGWGHKVKVWDVTTGKERVLLKGDPDQVWTMALSSDGTTLALSLRDGEVQIWDMGSGQKRASFKGHSGGVWPVALSHDGKTLVSGNDDGTVAVWHVGEPHQRAMLKGHAGGVGYLALSGDGKTLVSASYGGTVKVWDLGTGLELATSMTQVTAVGISGDSKTIVLGGPDSTARIWEVGKGLERATLKGRLPLALSRDGKTIVSMAGAEHAIKVFDVGTAKERATLKGDPDRIYSLALSGDGTTLVTGSFGGTIRVLDVGTGKQRAALKGHQGWVQAVALSGDGTTIVSGDNNDNCLRVWDVATAKERTTLVHAGWALALTWSADSRTLASATNGGDLVKVWDMNTAQVHFRIGRDPLNAPVVECLALSGDGNTLVTGSQDKTVRVWDVGTGQQRAALKGHTAAVTAVALSSDGKTIVSGSRDGTIKLWDVAAEQEHGTLKGHLGPVAAVALSGDDMTLVSGSSDGTVKVWDMGTRR